MILASSVFQDVQYQIHKEDNGDIAYDDFNRLSKMAEIKMLQWGTGNIAVLPGVPERYLTQKSKDFISFLITKSAPLTPDSSSQVPRPTDYYAYENMYALALGVSGGKSNCDEDDNESCEDSIDEEVQALSQTPIENLNGSEFMYRSRTYITGLRPSVDKPILKQVGKKFEFLPAGLSGVVLEYIRYPKYAEIKTKLDIVRNDLIVDEPTTQNYEWDENARPILVSIIVDLFSNHIREAALKTANESSNRVPNI